MPISFSCPRCGKELKGPDHAVGQSSKGPECGTTVTCPEPMAKQARRRGPEAEDLSTGDLIVAVLCSGIGIIAGIVWMIQGKPKGMKMVGLSVVMVVPQMVFWYLVNMMTWHIQHPHGGGF